MNKPAASLLHSYLIVSIIFLLLALALEILTWSYWKIILEPRLYKEAAAQAEFFGNTLVGAKSLELEQRLHTDGGGIKQRHLLENVLDELLIVESPNAGAFLRGAAFESVEDGAENIHIQRGMLDCQSCFRVENIPVYSSDGYSLLGVVLLVIDDTVYQTLLRDFQFKLFIMSGLGVLLLAVVWALVLLLFKQIHRAKEQVESAGYAKTRFLANISHELRTPLNAILGYAQLFQQDKKLMREHGQAVETIYRSGEHLLGLINDVLDFVKTENVHLQLFPEDFSFPEFLRSIAEMTRIRAQLKDIQFIYRAPDDLPAAVRADHKRLRQILLNLLGNAVKFTDTGHVEFTVEKGTAHAGAETLHFCVSDTGCGIPKEEQERIFLPFQQLGNTHNNAEGTGLGLTISRHLLELMGSQLQLSSQTGAGSRFCFTLELPLAANVPRGMERSVKSYQGRRREILVVDDNPFNRAMLKQLLRNFQFIVEECGSGEACLKYLQQKKPDLVFLDLLMPGIDGLETVRRIRVQTALRDLPVTAVSAAAGPDMRERALAEGCNEFLSKPVQLPALLECLHRQLKLTWIYEEKGAAARTAQNIDAPIEKLPPEEVLRDLLQLAQRHNILELRKKITALEEQDEHYQGFCAKLAPLVRQYRFKDAQNALDSFIQQSS